MTSKLLLASLFLLSLGLCDADGLIDPRLRDDFFAIYTHTAVNIKDFTDEHVTPDKVSFYLYTKNNVNDYVKLDPTHPKELVGKDATIVFIIHGWTEDRERHWYEDLKNAFLLRTENFYVIQVDWSEPAKQYYTVSSYNTKDVGEIIGHYIADWHKNYSIPLEKFLVVGHSLGGQVSGFIGKTVQHLTQKKLPRIIALDAAGPFFISRPEEERLNPNDAVVVECLHTDGGTFGFKPSCGTIDFYPNGGSSQPGCTKLDVLDITSIPDSIMCDHQRSWAYFIEAVSNPKGFIGTRCNSWLKYRVGSCEDDQVALGDLETTKTGEFYFETNRETPFAKIKSSGNSGSTIKNVVGGTIGGILKL